MVDCQQCGLEMHSNMEIKGFEVCIECSESLCDYCNNVAHYYEFNEHMCEDCWRERSPAGLLQVYNDINKGMRKKDMS